MRALRFVPVVLFLVALPRAFAQSPALKIEPPCPLVASPDGSGTEELHITYFPQRPGAQIKNPEELILKVAINGLWWRNNTRSVRFVHKAADVWEATLSRQEKKDIWLYLIFMVKDENTGQVDDNSGRYWDIIFCQENGQPHFQAIEARAKSYRGVQFDNGMARPVDFAQATTILEEYVNGSDWGRFNLLLDYWESKVQLHGGNDEAWRNLAAEIDQFLNDHRLDKSALIGASNFIILREDRLPPQLLPKMMALVEAIDPKQAAKLDRMATFNRIQREKDRRKKADELAEFIRKYPDDQQAQRAISEWFRILRDLGNVAGAETAFHERVKIDPGSPDPYAAIAAVYIENNVRLEEAVKLLEKADELAKTNQQNARSHMYLVLSPDTKRTESALAYWRARAYLKQGKGELALPLVEKALQAGKNSEVCLLAAQVYEVTGQTQKALDAYLQAVMQPSEGRVQQMERLERLWANGGFGSKEQLQQKIRSLEDERFKNAHYVPTVVDRPAPDFEFVTLKGEKFRSTDLREKTVVLNFWATWCAPCIPELAGFQELQQKHPELLVVALAIGSDVESMKKVIREQKLNTLRISQSDGLGDAFVPQAVPVTYVISHGRIRVAHHEPLRDVVAYIEADLAAMEKSAMATK